MSIISTNYNIYVRNSDLGSNVNLIVNFVNGQCTTPKAINLDTHSQIKPESTNTWEEGGFNGIHWFDNDLLLGTLSAYLPCYLCIKIKPTSKKPTQYTVLCNVHLLEMNGFFFDFCGIICGLNCTLQSPLIKLLFSFLIYWYT